MAARVKLALRRSDDGDDDDGQTFDTSGAGAFKICCFLRLQAQQAIRHVWRSACHFESVKCGPCRAAYPWVVGRVHISRRLVPPSVVIGPRCDRESVSFPFPLHFAVRDKR